MESARILVEVVAGIVPGTPIPKYTKQFAITSDVYYAQGVYEGRKRDAQWELFKVYGLANEYMRSLWNPSSVNWVRMDWIFL